MAIRDAEPERFEHAALRWLARFATEQAHTVADVREATGAMVAMRSDPDAALDVLRRLCGPEQARRCAHAGAQLTRGAGARASASRQQSYSRARPFRS